MKTVTGLIEMMKRLRDPAGGCPWDREQDFRSILTFTLEEVYELADAVDRGDFANLRDELGDLLFHLVFYARMAEEKGQFDFADVVAGIVDKLERRHPHVFGNEPVASAGDLNRLWELRKAEERRRDGLNGETGFLAGIPRALPALARALKLQQRAAVAGFDWPALPPVVAKLEEEVAEIKQAIADSEGRQRLQEEIGDLLFSAVNVARHAGVDPEAALRDANRKFAGRFGRVEAELAARGKHPEQSTLEEMDAIWRSLKP